MQITDFLFKNPLTLEQTQILNQCLSECKPYHVFQEILNLTGWPYYEAFENETQCYSPCAAYELLADELETEALQKENALSIILPIATVMLVAHAAMACYYR